MTPRYASLLVATLLVGATLGAGVAPAAAQTSDGNFVEFSVQDTGGLVDSIVGGVTGFASRGSVGDYVTDLLNNEPTPASQTKDLRTFINDHNASLVNHTNTVLDHYNASVADTTYVLELTVTNDERSGTTASTIYVVATADGSNITSAKVVNSTSKTVDRSRTMSWSKAKTLNKDLRDYHERFVKTGEVPPPGYITKIAAKYGNVSEVKVVARGGG